MKKPYRISEKNLKNYNVNIIVYIERQDDFIISNFQSALRNGRHFDINLEYSDFMNILGVNLHYIQIGWYEGKNPNLKFNTREYVMNNLGILDEIIVLIN